MAPRTCTRCVMDESDPAITFDADGVCNHCHEYAIELASRAPRRARGVDDLIDQIKVAGRNAPYDCVIGLSGGVDSSYVAHLLTSHGLRPLAVHLDNGWDSELAVENIERVVTKLDIELLTHVVDWEEFRDLQLALIRASVVDIELVTDHAIIALLQRTARKEHVRYVIPGGNFATEFTLPKAWYHRKTDLRNLAAIARRYGARIDTLPTASTLRHMWYAYGCRIRNVAILDYVEYDKSVAMGVLKDELGWRSYGSKHEESLFTRFYQTYILPRKFGIVKRRAHLSAMILAGQITRSEAVAALETSTVDEDALAADKLYVVKKLGLEMDEFDRLMDAPPRRHSDFPSDERYSSAIQSAALAVLRLTHPVRKGRTALTG